MLTEQLVFGLSGIVLFALGFRAAFTQRSVLRRVLAINIAGGGLFLVLVSVAYRGSGAAPDPVPHALVLTGIVVAFSATALALALRRRLQGSCDNE